MPRRRTGLTLESIWSNKVVTESGCWQWQGRIGAQGYGRVTRRNFGLVEKSVHRWAWEQARGPIPKGMLVCHTCDNRACFNPEHLFLGDHVDNAVDMVRKGRWSDGRHAAA